jgi:hypothetical protein
MTARPARCAGGGISQNAMAVELLYPNAPHSSLSPLLLWDLAAKAA